MLSITDIPLEILLDNLLPRLPLVDLLQLQSTNKVTTSCFINSPELLCLLLTVAFHCHIAVLRATLWRRNVLEKEISRRLQFSR